VSPSPASDLAILFIFDTHNPRAFEEQAGDEAVRADADVFPLHGWAQEGAGRAQPDTALGGGLIDSVPSWVSPLKSGLY
jgi:hypothetical protein